MLVVNLFGSPGSGKSTGAAYIFSKLKLAGINAELVTEFAKDMVWEENHTAFENQAYIFGEQCYRVSRLREKVDVVVTDSPILLSSFYNTDPAYAAELDSLVTKVFHIYDNYNVFINRVKPYNPSGRIHTEQESNQIVEDLLQFLASHGVVCKPYDGSIEGYDSLVKDILIELKGRGLDV